MESYAGSSSNANFIWLLPAPSSHVRRLPGPEPASGFFHATGDLACPRVRPNVTSSAAPPGLLTRTRGPPRPSWWLVPRTQEPPTQLGALAAACARGPAGGGIRGACTISRSPNPGPDLQSRGGWADAGSRAAPKMRTGSRTRTEGLSVPGAAPGPPGPPRRTAE